MRRFALVIGSVALLAACSTGGKDEPVSTTGATPPPFTTSSLNAALNFGGAGLPIVNQADATATVCPDIGCSDATTSDYVDILVFPDEESAMAYSEGEPDQTDRRGTVVMRFTDLTTENQRPLFQQALLDL